MKRWIIEGTALIAACLLSYWIGYRHVEVEEVEQRTQVVFYEKPQPIEITHNFATVSVPVLLFAPTDTIGQSTVIAIGKDSAQIQVPIERHEYRDSTYRAIVSGPVIGEYHPALDWIETYNTETLRMITTHDPYKWEVGLAIGMYAAKPGCGIWVGGQVRRNFGRFNITGAGGYDPTTGGGFLQATAEVTLWRK